MTKAEWQRRDRDRFKAENGYSHQAYYGTGRLRKAVLSRDNYRCARCGQSDTEHREEWGRPITVDHKDGNRKHNTLSNLETLCLRCHGKKDGNRQHSKLRDCQELVMSLRAAGRSCNSIAIELAVGCKVVTKWIRRWNGGKL